MQNNFSCLHFNELTALQLYHIIQLRIEVFVLEQKCPYNDTDNKDLQAHHVFMYDTSNVLVAHARLLPPGVSYNYYASIGRVVVKQSARQFGYGKQLMEFAVAQCKQLYGDIPIKISGQLYLEKFYNNLGFVTISEVYMEDDIEHIAMLHD